jgi:hypothetical protein
MDLILTLGDITSGAQARSPSSCMGIMYKSLGHTPIPSTSWPHLGFPWGSGFLPYWVSSWSWWSPTCPKPGGRGGGLVQAPRVRRPSPPPSPSSPPYPPSYYPSLPSRSPNGCSNPCFREPSPPPRSSNETGGMGLVRRAGMRIWVKNHIDGSWYRTLDHDHATTHTYPLYP